MSAPQIAGRLAAFAFALLILSAVLGSALFGVARPERAALSSMTFDVHAATGYGRTRIAGLSRYPSI